MPRLGTSSAVVHVQLICDMCGATFCAATCTTCAAVENGILYCFHSMASNWIGVPLVAGLVLRRPLLSVMQKRRINLQRFPVPMPLVPS